MLLIYRIVCGGSVFFFLLCITHLEEEERVCCFAFTVLTISCYCKCPVALSRSAWAGLQCVIQVFPYHTHLLFDTHRINEQQRLQ